MTALGGCSFLHTFILMVLEQPSTPPSGKLKQTLKFLQILSDPGLTSFHIHPPPLLFELIPLYSMCLLSSSLVRRVSSLPTLRDRVIQPEQYGAASCSRCSSAPLLFHMSSPLCLSGTQCVSAWGRGRSGGSATGRLNKVWQGQSWGIWFAPSS